MQRTVISAGSRSCLNANGSIPSRGSSDLTPRTIIRSFGQKKTAAPQIAALIDPRTRANRLKAAADKALQEKYDRNAYNKRYRERRKEKAEAKEEKEEDAQTYIVGGIYKRAREEATRDAMKAMKEDWHLGPLAPKRDVGEKAGKLGTVDLGLHELHRLTKTQRSQVEERMGDNVFKVHDRVVVLSGRDRGKIGQITNIDEEKMSATIDGINDIAVHVPKFMLAHDADTRNFRMMRLDVRLDELKIVVPVRDPVKGVKEVVLDRMDIKKVLVYAPGKTADIKAGSEPLLTDEDELIQRESTEAYELEDYKWKTLRYIPGTTTEIMDHSEGYDDYNPEAEYGPDDTLLISVEEQTYWPHIIEPPMSASVQKEITMKDAKSVTRFNEYIEESIREKAEAKMRKQLQLEDTIRTPLQELKLELKRVEHRALNARKAEFKGQKGTESTETPLQTSAEAREDANNAEETRQRKNYSAEAPVSDIMVTIGQAMARNWAKNPAGLTGSRRKLLEKALGQGNITSTLESNARV